MSISALETSAGMGEVAELLGLTPRTVRFYEERGLVTPTRDRRNQRRFDALARESLRLIAQLRKAGLSLAEIRVLIEGWRNGQAETVLATVRGRIEARRDDLRRQLAEVAQVEAWLGSQFLPSPAANGRRSIVSQRATRA